MSKHFFALFIFFAVVTSGCDQFCQDNPNLEFCLVLAELEDRQDGEPVEVQCQDSDSEEPGRYINSYFVPGSTTGIAYSDTPTLDEYGFTFGDEAQRGEEVTLLDTCLGESFIFEMACGEGDADNRVVWINHLDCADYGATCQTNDIGEGYCVCPEDQEFDPETEECTVRIIDATACTEQPNSNQTVCESSLVSVSLSPNTPRNLHNGNQDLISFQIYTEEEDVGILSLEFSIFSEGASFFQELLQFLF